MHFREIEDDHGVSHEVPPTARKQELERIRRQFLDMSRGSDD